MNHYTSSVLGPLAVLSKFVDHLHRVAKQIGAILHQHLHEMRSNSSFTGSKLRSTFYLREILE